MSVTTSPFARPWSAPQRPGERRVMAVLGAVALAVVMAKPDATAPLAFGDAGEDTAAAALSRGSEPSRARDRRTVLVGGYGGMSDTLDSTITIRNPAEKTDMQVRGFDWIGMPFKSPIYYGLRTIAWQPDGRLGAMLDFTHAKAIAKATDTAEMSGTRKGAPVPATGRIGDVFRHMEFSHGHNMVTLNGLVSFASQAARIRPYAGIGAGVSLPHTEVGFRDEAARTYEYQFTGFVGQALAGLEFKIGRVSLFLEYKFTYAPYTVPLSHEPKGDLLVTDLWRQAMAALSGKEPPGGWLTTPLVTHHGIGGVLVRVSGAPAP